MARASMMAIALCLMGTVAGCSKTFHGAAVQPNPLVDPTETLRDSEVIVIVTGDMDLRVPRAPDEHPISVMSTKPYKLENAATFTVVSRDRLRFHVQLEHKWRDWSDPGTWEVYMIDDHGRRYEPESVQRARPKHLVTMWDQETRSVQRDAFGNITEINDDGWKRRQPLGSLSVFRGRADFEFYQRDIFSEDVKSLTLVVKRKGVGFEFRWDFADSLVASGAD